MILLPGEDKLVTSNNEKIILTTHRIVMRDIERSYMHSIEIFLEDIGSVEVKYTSNVKLLQLGIFGTLIFAAFLYDLGSPSGPGIILMTSLVLIGLWWFSRQHIISITAKGGSNLSFRIEEIPLAKIEEFINKIQQAKAARIRQLYKI